MKKKITALFGLLLLLFCMSSMSMAVKSEKYGDNLTYPFTEQKITPIFYGNDETLNSLDIVFKSLTTDNAGSVYIRWEQNTFVDGYEIYYSTDKTFNSNTKYFVIDSSKCGVILHGCKKQTTYFFKIRGYTELSGNKHYGNWSEIKSITVIKKSPNSINAKNIEKIVSATKSVYKIKASAKDNAGLTYKSNNTSIKVDSKGNIIVSKNYIGKATITITAAETDVYKKTSKTITVKILPSTKVEFIDKPRKHTDENKHIGIYFAVKKSSGNPKYRIQIATSSDFSQNTIVYDKNRSYQNGFYLTTSGGVITLGKSYYIRIMLVKNGLFSGKWTTYKGKVKL